MTVVNQNIDRSISELHPRDVMNPSIFKAYDIRGESPSEIGPAETGRIAAALTRLHQPKTVVVGYDMRKTSIELEQALVESFTAHGVHVVRIGLCTTPMFNFAIAEASGAYDLGVMVTASHNPAKYNGLKITRHDNSAIGQGGGMEELRDLCCSDEPIPRGSTRGDVQDDTGILDRYLEKIWRTAGLQSSIEDWQIAIDAGNGMEGIVLPKLAKRLGATVHDLYWKLDGNFPHHEANPVKTETLHDLQQKVVSRGCVFGAAFDGDADRVGFVDELGQTIQGDILTALFAQEILHQVPGATILYDLRSTKAIKDVVEELGGTAIMCGVGHAGIKKRMHETQAVFAGELSMHFYFSEFNYCEASDYAMLLLIRIIQRHNKPLSEIWKPLQRYAHSGERNFQVRDTQAVLTLVEKHFAMEAKEISHLDGIRLDFGDWWFSLRASNTEPLIRLNLEAGSSQVMEQKVELVRACFASLILA